MRTLLNPAADSEEARNSGRAYSQQDISLCNPRTRRGSSLLLRDRKTGPSVPEPVSTVKGMSHVIFLAPPFSSLRRKIREWRAGDLLPPGQHSRARFQRVAPSHLLPILLEIQELLARPEVVKLLDAAGEKKTG